MIDRPMIGGYSMAPRTIADIKYCSGCKAHHPRSEFAKNLMTPDGLQGWCKKATKAYRMAKKASKEVPQCV